MRKKTQISIGGISSLPNPEINFSRSHGRTRFHMFLDIRRYEIHITKNIQLNPDKSLDLISNLQEKASIRMHPEPEDGTLYRTSGPHLFNKSLSWRKEQLWIKRYLRDTTARCNTWSWTTSGLNKPAENDNFGTSEELWNWTRFRGDSKEVLLLL